MPSFPSARIWLHCNGSRIKEYGETTIDHEDVYCDEKDKDLVCKVVFIELVPEAHFALKYIYDVVHAEGDAEWISLEVSSDGVPCDDFLTRKEEGNRKVAGSSAGHRTGPASCIPYRFGACRFAESSGLKADSALGSFEVTLEAMQRVATTADANDDDDFGWRVSRKEPVYDKDSKAGSLGYSLQSSKGASRPTDFINPHRYHFSLIPGMPRYKVTFLYRTRQYLVAHRFIEEGAPTGTRTSGAGRGSMTPATSSSAVPIVEMERLRDQNRALEAEVRRLRAGILQRRQEDQRRRDEFGPTGAMRRRKGREVPSSGAIVIDLTQDG